MIVREKQLDKKKNEKKWKFPHFHNKNVVFLQNCMLVAILDRM